MTDRIDPLLGGGGAGAEWSEVDDGSAHLPGSDRPEWLLPVVIVGLSALIAWLVIFGQDDDSIMSSPNARPADTAAVSGDVSIDGDADADGDVDATPGDPDATAPSGPSAASDDGTASDAGAASDDGGADPGAVVDPIGDAEAAAEAAEAEAQPPSIEVDLPPVGAIRVGDSEFPLLSSCVGLRPLAPNSDDDIVSAHVFSPDGEREQVVERWYTATGIDGVRVDGPGAAGLRQVSAADASTDGAFAATFEQPDGGLIDVVVNPLPEAARGCDEVVVTNEPGQFAFPHTRAVLAVCADDDPAVDGRVVAMLTERGRMLATSNGDGTHTLTLRTAENLLGPQLELTDSSGQLFADGTALGYSGLVSDGETSFDLTFDVDVAAARPCTDDDV